MRRSAGMRAGLLIIIIIFIILPLEISGIAWAQNEFDLTARRNQKLVKTTPWSFGTPQKGFEIYVPMIQKTIGTRASVATPEFAQALKKWQELNHSPKSNGVLDASAFNFFKETWQEARQVELADKQPLVEIRKEHRYDPNRDDALCKIGADTYSAYKKMFEAAKADGISGDELKIVSSNRDSAHLKMLQKKVSDSRKVGFSIASKKSVHFTGRALDLYVGGKPVSTANANRLIQIKSKGYLWLVEHAEKYGFKNYFYEPWHWEYVGD